MKKLCVLLLMAHYAVSIQTSLKGGNLNTILDRDEWTKLATEYIKNHKPYIVKKYEQYKPGKLNLTIPSFGPEWETTTIQAVIESTTVEPELSTNYSTEEISTTTSSNFDLDGTTEETTAQTTTTDMESLADTTEQSHNSTEIPESTTNMAETTTSSSNFDWETTPIIDTTTVSFREEPKGEESETTTEQSSVTTEGPVTSNTGSWDALETTTDPSVATTESPETSTSVLEIIATTEGIETTIYLDTLIYNPQGENIIDLLNSTTTEVSNIETSTIATEDSTTEGIKATTLRSADLVEDFVKPKPRNFRYSSDTRPEPYWL